MGLRSLSSTTFRSLRVRNFRLYFFGELVSMIGSWITLVALGWLLLDISDSAVALGVLTALDFVPVVVAGGVGVFDVPANGAFAAELVGVDEVENAVALDSASFQVARVLGPAVAGLLIAQVGIGACFVFDGVSYLASILALVAMRPADLQRPDPIGRAAGQVREGLRYVWDSPAVRTVIVLMAVAGILGLNSTVILPLLAKDTFGQGAGALGLMSSAMGVGAVLGALLVASRTEARRRPLLAPGLALGAAMLLAAAAPSLGWMLPVLVIVGASTTALFASGDAALQRGSEPTLRGRVMAVFGVVYLGSLALGGLVSGFVSELRGPRFAVAVGGAMITLAVAVLGPAAGATPAMREAQ